MPALTRTAVRTRARALLNEPTARFFTDTEINSWIDDAVSDISIKTYCSQTRGTAFATVSGTNAYAWPTTVDATTSITVLHVKTIVDSNNVSLEPVTIDMMGRVNDTETPKYILWERKIIFTPTPTAVYTYTPYLLLEARQTAAGSINLPLPYQHLTVLFVTAMGKAKRRDMDNASTYFQTYNAEINRIYQQLTGTYGPIDDRQRLKDQAPTD